MNLYVITRATPAGRDEAQGFVVAAEDATDARSLASSRSGDEWPGLWIDPFQSECHLIGQAMVGQESGVLMRDFFSG